MKGVLLALVMCGLVAHINAACSDPRQQNCDSCSNPAVQCVNCDSGWGKMEDFSGCVECSDECLNCHESGESTKCDSCAAHYVLHSDGTCVECTDGCDKCRITTGTSTECQQCYNPDSSDRYYVLLADKNCAECPSNCQQCTSTTEGDTTCSQCKDGYAKKRSDNSCMACPRNCDSCKDDGAGTAQCTKCDDRHELNSESPTGSLACLPCPATCSSCEGTNNGAGNAVCSDCNPGYVLPANGCTECTANCEDCAGNSECAKCEERYRLDSGTCADCPSRCLECTLDDGVEQCTACDGGYGTKEATSRTCDGCPSNCKECDAADPDTCNTCVDEYVLDDAGDCVACPSDCNSCSYNSVESRTDCTDCKTGFGPDATAVGCDACGTNCDDCSSGSNVPCVTCTTPTEYFPMPVGAASSACAKCPTGCTTCSDSATCTACETGYSLDGGTPETCMKCPTGCTTCSAADTCTACETGYSLDGGTPETCMACGSKCDACTAGTDEPCTACETGYVVKPATASSSACGSCPSDCKDASCDNTETCTDCEDGYAINNGECAACPANCITCSYDSGNQRTECSDCEEGSVENPDDGRCASCPDNCKSCTWSDANGRYECVEDQCESGYGLKSDGQCYECPAHCELCPGDEADALICTDCDDVYYLNEETCAVCVDNCVACDDNDGTMECTACADEYALQASDKTCKKCPNDCNSCRVSSSGTVTCDTTGCNVGFGRSLDGTSCVACSDLTIDNCNSCENEQTNGTKCFTCDLYYALSDDGLECLDCSTELTDCNDCYDPVLECIDCDPGYEITDDKYCAYHCYTCGDYDTGDWRSQEECGQEIDVEDETSNFSTTACPVGSACYTYESKDANGVKTYIRGCYTEAPEERCQKKKKECRTSGNTEECDRCCIGNRCNSKKGSGAPTTAVVSLTTIITTLMAFVLMK